MVTRPQTEQAGGCGLLSGMGRSFSASQYVQVGSGIHPAFCLMGAAGAVPRIKTAGGHS